MKIDHIVLYILLLSGMLRPSYAQASFDLLPTNRETPKNMMSDRFKVSVNGSPIRIFLAKVGAADERRRFKAVDNLLHSEDYFDEAGFGYFSFQRLTSVKITVGHTIKKIKVLPKSANIKASFRGKDITFKIYSPGNITVEIDDDIIHSLHLFANPKRSYHPQRNDPNLVYFGPGVHEVTSMIIGDNKTVYLAPGAIVKAVVGKDEKFTTEPSGLRNYDPTFVLKGNNIKFMGPGIIDASASPTHARSLITLNGSNITFQDVILLNSSGWTVPLWECDNVHINNIKIIGYRANSDGIDICNSKNVTVEDCFIRTNDDLIVVKAFENKPSVENITVKKCILWNQLAHALSIGAEVRADIRHVKFSDCEIIHDTGREWSLRVFNSDHATVSAVTFEDIKISDAHNVISLWLGKLPTSYNDQLGHIDGITFKNIHARGVNLRTQILGGDSSHKITDISFNNVFLNNNRLNPGYIQSNRFADEPSIK